MDISNIPSSLTLDIRTDYLYYLPHHHWAPSPSEVLMFLCNLDCFSHLLRWGPDLPDFESTFESTFESVTFVGGWWKRATCRVDGSEEQTCLSFCLFFGIHINTLHPWKCLALSACISCNYNYGTEAYPTCKQIQMRALNFWELTKINRTVWSLNEHKIWRKQRVLWVLQFWRRRTLMNAFSHWREHVFPFGCLEMISIWFTLHRAALAMGFPVNVWHDCFSHRPTSI